MRHIRMRKPEGLLRTEWRDFGRRRKPPEKSHALNFPGRGKLCMNQRAWTRLDVNMSKTIRLGLSPGSEFTTQLL